MTEWGLHKTCEEATSLWRCRCARKVGGIAVILAVYVLIAAAWLWALFAVAHRRRTGVVAVLALSAILLIGLWVGTVVALCPSPCQTAWPLMEVSNWAGLALGIIVWIAGSARLAGRS